MKVFSDQQAMDSIGGMDIFSLAPLILAQESFST